MRSVANIVTCPWPLISAIIFIYRCLHLIIFCLLLLYPINSFFEVLPLYHRRQRTRGSHPALWWPSTVNSSRFWFFEKWLWSLLDILIHITIIICGMCIHWRQHVSIYFFRWSWEAYSMLSRSTNIPFLFLLFIFNLAILFSFSKLLWCVYTIVVWVKLELLVHCCFHELGIDIGEQAAPSFLIRKIVLSHDLLYSLPFMDRFFTYLCSTPLT